MNGKQDVKPLDKKLLKILVTTNGKYSSKDLARRLGIPATTVQRRRKHLEKEFLRSTSTLDHSKFGWHKVDFFISTESGKTELVGKTLLKRSEVVFVGKCIGQRTIDLRVETILGDNAAILRMMDLLKATPGVKDVVWTEIVEVVGSKASIPLQMIDQL